MACVTSKDSPVNSQKDVRGFTLTEIALVLGIIGLILGAIWVAAGSVYNNMRVSRAETELIQITQAILSLYAASDLSGDGSQELTTALVGAKAFPMDTIAASTGANNSVLAPVGPWGGSYIRVYSATQPGGTGTTGDSFQVLFNNVPAFACISLVVSATGTGRDTALVAVNFASPSGAKITPTALTASINAVAAAAGCGTDNVDVAFTFSLRG